MSLTLGADYEREVRAIRNRTHYSQEQALAEISRMIDDGKLPYYIVGKGQYSYTPGINSVYTTTNVNLRSQPNTEARIITVVRRGGDDIIADGWVPPELSDYLGEWTSPQGETWVLVNYRPYAMAKPNEKKLGWLSRKYVGFLTDSQVAHIADIFDNPSAYENGSASSRYAASQPEQQSSYTSGGGGNVETVSAEKLLQAYIANPYKAQKTYEGKTIELLGKIYEVTSKSGTPVVVFSYGVPEVWCYVSGNDYMLSEIETGGYATVRGYVSKVDAGRKIPAYVLTNCKIISTN